MKKKRIIAPAVALFIVIVLIASFAAGRVSSNRYSQDYFSKGAELIAYNIGVYEENGDKESFIRAGADVAALLNSEEGQRILDTQEKRETVSNLADVFTYEPQKLMPSAKRLRSAFELLSENPTDESAFKQIRAVLNSLDE